MYIVSKFLDIQITLSSVRQNRLETLDPRDFQSQLTAAVSVALPSGTSGNKIRVFCERLQDSTSVSIAGSNVSTVKDLYLERSRAIRTFTPSSNSISVDLGLSESQRAGTIVAWLTSNELEISDEVIAAYPFSGNLSPRVSSERKEDGEEIVKVVGPEPILALTLNLRAEAEDDPDPDAKLYKILRALSPQGEFFFFGRNISEAYIIGKSARRSVKHVYSEFGREVIQPILMEVL